MQRHLTAMVEWIVAAGFSVGIVGAYPTWVFSGIDGLWAELAAGLIVLVLVIADGWLVVRLARRGPRAATFGFVIASAVIGAASLALAVAAWAAIGLKLPVLLLWVAIFYLATLLGLSAWLARQLQQVAMQADKSGRAALVGEDVDAAR